MKKSFLPTLCIIGSGITWGCTGIFTTLLSREGFNSAQISAFRMISAAILLSLYILIKDKSFYKIKISNLPILIAIGAISIFGASFCYFASIEASSIAIACILMYTSPFIVIIASIFLYKEKLTIKKFISLILAFIGCVFVSGTGNVSIKGIIFGLMAGVTYGTYSLFCKNALTKMNSYTIMLYGFIIAALCSFCSTDVISAIQSVSNFKTVLLILGIGTLTSIVPYLLYSYGLKKTEAGKAAILAMIEPLVATIVSVFVFRQPLTPLAFLGILLIILGVIIIEIKVKKNEN